MLVVSRYVGERVHIGDDIVVEITQVRGDKVKIGITAPPNVLVLRSELYQSGEGQQPAKQKRRGQNGRNREHG